MQILSKEFVPVPPSPHLQNASSQDPCRETGLRMWDQSTLESRRNMYKLNFSFNSQKTMRQMNMMYIASSLMVVLMCHSLFKVHLSKLASKFHSVWKKSYLSTEYSMYLVDQRDVKARPNAIQHP